MDNDFKLIAKIDIAKRTLNSSFIYFTCWLIVSFWLSFIENNTKFFSIITLIFIFLCIYRAYITKKILNSKEYDNNLFNILKFLVIFNALYWSSISSYIIYCIDSFNLPIVYHQTVPFMLVITLTGFAIGGSSVMAMCRTLSLVYSFILFTPVICTGFIIGFDDIYVLTALACITLIYVFISTKNLYDDYWLARKNQKIADEKIEILEQISITDPLTSLFNRFYFDRIFENEWVRCLRSKKSLSLIIIDMDYFKEINDTYGHQAGDECIKQMGNFLKKQIRRKTDIVSRYGGDEFIMLLPETNLITAENIAENLINQIKNHDFKFNEVEISLSCSIGIANVVPNTDINQKDLFKFADQALYKAKTHNRNCYYSHQITLDNSTNI